MTVSGLQRTRPTCLGLLKAKLRSATNRELCAVALRASGVPWLIRRVVGWGHATILLYHDPEPETLDRHLAYLAKRYQFISLDTLVEALHSGDWSQVPPYSLVVTIDDGWRGNRLLGDVFKKHRCRPTLYVCTGLVGTHRRLWFSMGQYKHLKGMPHHEWLQVLKQEIAFEPTREYFEWERQVLDEAELRALSEWADVGSHTRFHPILTTCEAPECESEVRGSRADLEKLMGAECAHFSYPNGDFTEREIDVVKRAGYRSARTTDYGWNGKSTSPYELRVAGATDDASVSMLAVQLSCIVSYARCALRGNFRGETRKNVLDPRYAR